MLRFIFCLLLSSFTILHGKEKICLNMIVKDEKDVIRRCLDSVKAHIDYWVIVDTGSTDGTQEIIKEHMKDIPGVLHERPWKNWGETRTEALNLAQGCGDYLLFMDADDVLEFEPGQSFGKLTKDVYDMWRGSEGFTYLKSQLVKSGLPWSWIGVTHEYLDCPTPYSRETLKTVRYRSLDGGATWKDLKQKFMKNVVLLEEGLKQEPHNARYAFYLAESYRDAKEKGKALECFQNRIKMGGWDEEVFWSLLQSAHLLKDLGLPSSVVIEAYLAAFRFRPHRSEPIYFLAELYISEKKYQQAYDLIQLKKTMPQPSTKDSLFNLDWVEDYGLDCQLSICTYYIGKYNESVEVCDRLLENPRLSDAWKKQTLINKQLSLVNKIKEQTVNESAKTQTKLLPNPQ